MKTIVLILCIALSRMASADAKTIIVSAATRIPSLKKAVELASNGDTILVKKGTYISFNTIINKEVTVMGLGYPVLDARLQEEVLTILANHVTFDGFVIKNSKTGAMRDYAGIRLHKVKNVTLSNNRLINNFFGIYLSDSKNIRLINNRISGTFSALNSGNGIHLWQCSNITLKNNYSTGNRDGIYFEFVKKSLIEQNKSEKNFRYGLHFMFSDDNLYHKNTFKNNGSGVAVMYSKRIKMLNNLFLENWGSSIYGLLLKDISLSDIKNNRFVRNTTGMYMEGCEGINTTQNSFNNNGWAIRVLANSENCTFTQNNFYANSFDVTTNGTLNLNHFAKNYWDKYEGYDMDKNGTGDVPYRPISLFAQIIEQIPQSVMLMRSFIVELKYFTF